MYDFSLNRHFRWTIDRERPWNGLQDRWQHYFRWTNVTIDRERPWNGLQDRRQHYFRWTIILERVFDLPFGWSTLNDLFVSRGSKNFVEPHSERNQNNNFLRASRGAYVLPCVFGSTKILIFGFALRAKPMFYLVFLVQRNSPDFARAYVCGW